MGKGVKPPPFFKKIIGADVIFVMMGVDNLLDISVSQRLIELLGDINETGIDQQAINKIRRNKIEVSAQKGAGHFVLGNAVDLKFLKHSGISENF